MTFSTVPPVPQQSNLTDWEIRFHTAMKQNVELLTGLRDGSTDDRAIIRGQLNVSPLGDMQLQSISAQAAAVSISGSPAVVLQSDYIKLIQDVAALANDVAAARAKLSALIIQLNGST